MASEANVLDEINRRLLDELQRDGRIAFAELGRRVGLSAPAVAERVSRLEGAGVIRGYHAEVDPAGDRLPARRPWCACVRSPASCTRSPRSRRDARGRRVRAHHRRGLLPAAPACARMSELEPVLDRFTPFGQTTTSLVHSSPVPRRPLPLDTGV